MTDSPKKFKVATLGCRTNQYESQAYQDQLIQMGYRTAEQGENADLCIINTCTVTQSAENSSKHDILQLARQNPGAKIVVTGCAVEGKTDDILKLPGVTHVVANQQKENLLASIFPEDDIPEFSIKNFDAHTRAFVKVQDGCNSFCTYCIIPYTRGRSRSRNLEDILQEVRSLIANGYKEVVLTGINIGDFDGNVEEGTPPVRLSDLVRAVDKIPGVERVRVSSIDPDEVDDDLADAILSGKNTCHSMHIVLQSGSNVILKRMNRKYTRQIFMSTVDRLLAASPDFTFTTDVIVGFPGETESDFADTLEVMKEVKFAKVHMFPYSERSRTRAATLPNKVKPEVIKQRKHQVLHISEQISYDLRQRFLGRTMKVLTESMDNNNPGLISGHTENFLMVFVPSQTLKPNELVDVRLVENTPEGFIGEICHAHHNFRAI